MQKLKGKNGEMGWSDNTGLEDDCRIFTKNGESVDCSCRCVPFGKGLTFEYAPECKVHGIDSDKEYFTPGATGIITPRTTPQPHWTKEPPTVPGWYWCNIRDIDPIIFVTEIDDDLRIYPRDSDCDYSVDQWSSWVNAKWCGPITPPV